MDALASSHLPNQVKLRSEMMAGNVLSVSGGVRRQNRFAIELREKDMRDGAQHRFWRIFQQVGKTHQDSPFSDANGVVYIGKAIKLNDKLGDGRSRTQFAVFLLENFNRGWDHVDSD